jgi:hypothetical protein
MRRANVWAKAVIVVICSGMALTPRRATASAERQDAQPVPQVVDTPTVKVLRGLTAPDFDNEMKLMAAALGVSCTYCHVRGDFASDANAHKTAARRMLEMTKAINQQFFSGYTPAPEESRLGRVTCQTCHQGSEHPGL